MKQTKPDALAAELAQAYSPTVRAVEIASVVSFFGFQALLVYRLWGRMELGPLGWALLLVGSYLWADFISGLFHWAADTWGSPTMPVIGGLFVRPFREHHVDPMSITRHDFIEVTGGNCAICIPWFLVHLFPLETGGPLMVRGAAFLGIFLFWIFTTSLSHRWAHSNDPPKIAIGLQKLGLLLPHDHHQRHHVPPHTTCYCITVGILNHGLDAVGFFRGLEVLVHAVTGLIPREDEHLTVLAGVNVADPADPALERIKPKALDQTAS